MSSAAPQRAPLHPRIQELIDYITMHRDALHEAVSTVPSELRERKPEPGRWSVAEVLEHLSLIEGRVAALLTMHATAARTKGIGPDPETSSVVASFVNPHNVTDRTTKIVAPKPVTPTGTLDTPGGTQALQQSRAAMLDSLHGANGVSLESLVQAHPVLGPLNMYHWIVALGLHDARHAAQIREIGQSLAPG
ncbi:MAG: DinB family protein [Gemmatimonadaceae bacterium]|nr:DinB family protein [Gemmatimonadaceae bacterium]